MRKDNAHTVGVLIRAKPMRCSGLGSVKFGRAAYVAFFVLRSTQTVYVDWRKKRLQRSRC